MTTTDTSKGDPPDYYGDEPGEDITQANALVVIARELRFIRRTLHTMTFDPNCETATAGVERAIDGLDERALARIADAIEAHD